MSTQPPLMPDFSQPIGRVAHDLIAKLSGLPTDDPRFETSLLLEHVLQTERGRLPLYYQAHLNTSQADCLARLVERRMRHEPLQYILATWSFMNLNFTLQPGALIPRPETEDILEQVIPMLDERFGERPFTLLDIGTGSGAIGLALLHRFPHATGCLTDISATALHIARTNCLAYPDLETRTQLLQANLLTALRSACCDLIISNPPYIPGHEINRLMPEVREFEPVIALDGGPDGLAVIRQLLANAASCLRPRGVLVLEHAWNQRTPILQLPAPGLHLYFSGKDRGDRERFLVWHKT